MANALGNGLLNAAYWSKVMQEVRYKELVAMAIASVELRSVLKDGDTVHKPYRSQIGGQAYTKGTAFVVQDISGVDDTLVVDTARIVPFYLDDVDSIQNSYNTADEFAADSMDKLNRYVDADILGEYVNATSDIDDGDVGGTPGNTIAVTTTNIQKIFTAAARKLDLLNVSGKNRFAVISPSILEILRQYLEGKDTSFGDEVGNNGLVANRFGFNLHLSNNLAYTGTWTPANNPTTGATVTINGVVFTFATTPSAAGEVDVGSDTAGSLDNLVAAVNNSTGYAPGAGIVTSYFEVSAANRALLEGCVATDGATAMTIVFKGGSELVVATSEAADPWSAETLHLLFGQKGATNLVMQKSPSIVIKDVSDKLGKNYAPWMLYGKKTFNNDKDKLVDVKIDGSAL